MRREPLIWISCLEKERTIKEIQDAWNITPDNYLYRGNMASKMSEKGLLKIIKVQSNNIFYLASFSGYFKEKESKNILPSEKFNEKDQTAYIPFLEKLPKNFFAIDNLKILFNNNAESAKKLGLGLPIILILNIAGMHIFLKQIGLTESNFSLFKRVFSFTRGEEMNLSGYFDNVFTFETFQTLLPELEKIEKTDYYKSKSKETEKMIKELEADLWKETEVMRKDILKLQNWCSRLQEENETLNHMAGKRLFDALYMTAIVNNLKKVMDKLGMEFEKVQI